MRASKSTKKYTSGCEEQSLRMVRQKRQQLLQTEKQNLQSRDMLQKLQQNPDLSKRTHRQFQWAENSLKQLSINIDLQSRKNYVLKQIVRVMQQDLTKNRKAEEQEASVSRLNREKQVLNGLFEIKKEEYDIEQVLQRHNEEIAKINTLREEVAAERSQRVVYSNLFRKLESEIKHYQEEFKDTLLMSFMLDSRREELMEQSLLHRKKPALNSNPTSAHNPVLLLHPRTSFKFQQVPFDKSQQHDTFFLTKHTSRAQKASQSQPRRLKALRTSQDMDKYRNIFERLQLETGFATVEELLEQLPAFEEGNERLAREVAEVNEQIFGKEAQLRRGREDGNADGGGGGGGAGGISVGVNRGKHGKQLEVAKPDWEVVANSQQELNSQVVCLSELANCLNIHSLSGSNYQQVFTQVQNRLNELTQIQIQCGLHFPPLTAPPAQPKPHDECQAHIETLIQKLERYNQSQRILSADEFRSEYVKLGRSPDLQKFKKLRQLQPQPRK